MIDIRCKNCNKLLAKANLMDAAIKCSGCKGLFEYKVFSNMFVTNQYDPTLQKSLRFVDGHANIPLEPDEVMTENQSPTP